jgi:hypothetical protein
MPHGAKPLPCALVDAQILATLTNGDTVVATFTGGNHGNHHDDGDDDGHDAAAQTDGEVLNVRATPNPLHPNTVLSFELKHDGRVRVAVYDMSGRAMKALADEFRTAGAQTLGWDGTNDSNVRVPSGIYFFRIQGPDGFVTRRVAVVK